MHGRQKILIKQGEKGGIGVRDRERAEAIIYVHNIYF
jgi:hypothetical protein